MNSKDDSQNTPSSWQIDQLLVTVSLIAAHMTKDQVDELITLLEKRRVLHDIANHISSDENYEFWKSDFKTRSKTWAWKRDWR